MTLRLTKCWATAFILCVTSGASYGAEVGVLETYVKKAITQVEEGSIQAGMTSLRIGINSNIYKPESPSDDLQKSVQATVDKEKDEKKSAALKVIQAVIYIVIPEKREQAIGILGEAEKLDGALPEVYNTRAVLLIAKGQQDRALADLNKAIELNPSYVDALKNRAGLHAAMKHPEKAVEDSVKYQTLLGEITNKKP